MALAGECCGSRMVSCVYDPSVSSRHRVRSVVEQRTDGQQCEINLGWVYVCMYVCM